LAKTRVNHLAHALLAGPNDDMLLGSLLGDFWRGAPDPAWPAGVRAGVVLHRKIDVYTDSHPYVAVARSQFEAPWRRYAGILIDIYFDHVLARDWPRHAHDPLDAFSARCADLLERHTAWLPADLNRFTRYFRAHGLFAAYAQRSTIEQVLDGISRRLRHPNPLAQAGPALWALADELDAAFVRFFPDLDAYARELRAALRLAVND
jgi:acyl carrier protein phosphodiesterase